ncbi:hypothetical protein GJV85_01595 [Sulfurimonas aquatica]|uniref:FecR protein domain-containing protein n=1 Tax=Sulfurimonas aquatica TaxID=2672570 RepID=A0A975AYC5_9BACT|nr:FecR domain-containing protein [Sulfurimonas aquatica]QSZ40862.1 hypothetical protein GJV85_01595 [Sulfurimonas aquatica]
MKLFILIIMLTSALFANIGKISSMRGSCEITRAGTKIDAKVGVLLEEKDVLNTAKKSKLQIIFKDGSIVTIGKSSTLNIAEYAFNANKPKKAKASFGFLKGSFKSITGEIGKIAPDKFKLRTKTATIGIRGTTIVGNQEKVACTQGTITITSYGVTRVVPAGMFSRTPKNRAPSLPQAYAGRDTVDPDIDDAPSSSGDGTASSDHNELDDIPGEAVTPTATAPTPSEIDPNPSNRLSSVAQFLDETKQVDVKNVESNVLEKKPVVAQSVDDIALEIIAASSSASIVESVKIDTTGLSKVTSFTNDYLEYGYWEEAGAPLYTYLTGVVTSSDTIDQMIRSSASATYNGGLSSIVTTLDGNKVASGGSVTLDVDFINKSFSGNVNVEEGGFGANVAGDVHKYGFDTTSVTTAVGSDATNVGGSLNGQFYGTNAEAAGGKFNLTSDNAGSVNGLFGATRGVSQ